MLMEPLVSNYYSPFFFFFILFASVLPLVGAGDAEALLALRSSINNGNSLQWSGADFCKWNGVKECRNGRVTKLVLEHLNLSAVLDGRILNRLDQLRVLSFKGNSLSGRIPDLSALLDLKSLFLSDNNFSGDFPKSIPALHRLKVIVLSGNQISGRIPVSLTRLRRLYILYLENNRFSGDIPPLNQTALRFLNVSNNQLSGEIPATSAFVQFEASSFSGNIHLCGEQIHIQCTYFGSSPSPSPTSAVNSKWSSQSKRKTKIITGTIGGFVGILIIILLVWCLVSRKRMGRKSAPENGSKKTVTAERREVGEASDGGRDGNNGEKQGGFSWEGEDLGSLVICEAGDQQMSYSLEDLLKASAETLGRGSVGSTYKAVMESGYIVTVKRLKDAKYPRLDDFRGQMAALGRLRHPNLVPIRAYFQATEERLLIYDYFPNGSLFTLVHGSRTSAGGKPLHWTSCLKIAEDVANGLLYIHQNNGFTHGNLKSSNVLLGPDFESCLTDYGLTSFRDPDSMEEPSALFYESPECRDMRKPSTQPADVYSFGVLLLELLTGKTPFQDLVQEHDSDIPTWVRSVRDEETESGDDQASEEKLQALLNITMACVTVVPENRPAMREVLKMIRESRGEARVSSNTNSSEHSPGRWSDTIQSFPREAHLSI